MIFKNLSIKKYCLSYQSEGINASHRIRRVFPIGLLLSSSITREVRKTMDTIPRKIKK
jgi:hypothetical protein